MVAKSVKTGAAAAVNSAEKRFKGVRMRSWGKWVSEIRLPNTRARLWLGSFTTAEQAARAFDVAVVCLRGRSATLNFPQSPPAYAPLGLPPHQIQELAAAAAAPLAIRLDSPSSSMSTQSEPTESFSTQSESESTQSECEFSESTPAVSTQSHQSAPATTAQCASPSTEVSLSPSYSGCEELEVATPSDTCSSTWLNTDSLEDLQSSPSPSLSLPLEYYLQEEQLGVQWDELLWGSYSAWDQQLLTFPDDDLLVEPCLWNL